MIFDEYSHREALPLFRGGGFEIVKRYKKSVTESYCGLDCNIVYNSIDGVIISSINLSIPSLLIKEKIQADANIELFVKDCFLKFINKPIHNELFLKKYNKAKQRYSNLYDVYICSFDVSFECRRFFSYMIYNDFGKMIA